MSELRLATSSSNLISKIGDGGTHRPSGGLGAAGERIDVGFGNELIFGDSRAASMISTMVAAFLFVLLPAEDNLELQKIYKPFDPVKMDAGLADAIELARFLNNTSFG